MIDKSILKKVYGGLAQLVERQLCKLDVRSSILLASKKVIRNNCFKSSLTY